MNNSESVSLSRSSHLPLNLFTENYTEEQSIVPECDGCGSCCINIMESHADNSNNIRYT
jgi:uncharacterized cysteine cluster protein YcgN (CxxCxxCC family)